MSESSETHETERHKPNRIVRWWRRWVLRRCPYCKKKLESGTIGLFLHGFYGCRDGHYAEEDVMGEGTIVYDKGGESIFPQTKSP